MFEAVAAEPCRGIESRPIFDCFENEMTVRSHVVHGSISAGNLAALHAGDSAAKTCTGVDDLVRIDTISEVVRIHRRQLSRLASRTNQEEIRSFRPIVTTVE